METDKRSKEKYNHRLTIQKRNYIMIIYPNIRNLREDNDKTQEELAAYLNMTQTNYSKYELGKINIPIEVFIKLADYYDVTVDYLVSRKHNKS